MENENIYENVEGKVAIRIAGFQRLEFSKTVYVTAEDVQYLQDNNYDDKELKRWAEKKYFSFYSEDCIDAEELEDLSIELIKDDD